MVEPKHACIHHLHGLLIYLIQVLFHSCIVYWPQVFINMVGFMPWFKLSLKLKLYCSIWLSFMSHPWSICLRLIIRYNDPFHNAFIDSWFVIHARSWFQSDFKHDFRREKDNLKIRCVSLTIKNYFSLKKREKTFILFIQHLITNLHTKGLQKKLIFWPKSTHLIPKPEVNIHFTFFMFPSSFNFIYKKPCFFIFHSWNLHSKYWWHAPYFKWVSQPCISFHTSVQ